MRHHEIEPKTRDQFEGGDLAARFFAREIEQCEGVGRRGQADKGGRDRPGLGKELQDGRRDDFERSLRADEEILEVIAGIVFFQLGKTGVDASVGKHGLDAEHEIARGAIGDDARAAGVGGEIAADGAGALGGEGEGKQAADAIGFFPGRGEHHAGLDRHRAGGEVDVAQGPHALQRKHDRPVLWRGDLAADKAGIAALRHDGRARRAAKPDDGGDLRRRAGTDDAERAAPEQVARLGEISRHIGGLRQHIRRADDRLQSGDEALLFRDWRAEACHLRSFKRRAIGARLSNCRPPPEARRINLALCAFRSLIFFGASRYRCGLRRSVAQFG